MYIAIRKEPNGTLYMDKNFFNRYNDFDLGRYNYTKVEVKDEYVLKLETIDFNDDLTFNESKYLARIEEENKRLAQQSYEDAIVTLVRRKYNLNQELAILRQRDTKPEEFSEYNAYVEQCKQEVKNNLTSN
jgi:hypothetical protein